MTNRLVYSTDFGRVKAEKPTEAIPKGDGIVRIMRQTSGRKGKGVSIIKGLALDKGELGKLASELKKKFGCGGSVKGFEIEIQGDNREQIADFLRNKGFVVKIAGG